MLTLPTPRWPSRRSHRSIKWGLGLGLATVLAAAGGVASAHTPGGSGSRAVGAAVTESVSSYDRGSYTSVVYQDNHVSYNSDPDSTYFTAGRADNPTTADPRRTFSRDFFAFDLPPTDATVTRAVLVLKFNGAAYDSRDDSETLALYDVSTNVDTLTAGGDNTPGLGAIYDDLGSGHQYASRTFTAADQ